MDIWFPRPIRHCLVAAALAPCLAFAQQTITELQTTQAQMVANVKSIATQRDEKLEAAKKGYIEVLERLQKEAAAKGDLDGALSVKAERDAAAGQGAAGEKKPLPPTIQALRTRFDQGTAQIQTQAVAQETAVLRNYVTTLDALQKRLTMQNDLDGAVKVREERQSAATRLAEMEGGKAPTASASSTPGATPLASTPAPVVTTPFAGFKIAPIFVAVGLQSNKGATKPQQNTVEFDAPRGDGRRGAKGILLKANPGNGSTWSFKYIRNHNAEGQVQIIHPMGRGQALVTIRATEIKVAAPDTWAQVGWGGGDSKNVSAKPAFKKVFPLKDDVEYSVVSRMSAGGAIEVLFDGELVATARVAGPHPLSLEIPAKSDGKAPSKFSGADLPMVWSPGWAGIIAGPVDGTRNELADLHFFPGVNDMPAGR